MLEIFYSKWTCGNKFDSDEMKQKTKQENKRLTAVENSDDHVL